MSAHRRCKLIVFLNNKHITDKNRKVFICGTYWHFSVPSIFCKQMADGDAKIDQIDPIISYFTESPKLKCHLYALLFLFYLKKKIFAVLCHTIHQNDYKFTTWWGLSCFDLHNLTFNNLKRYNKYIFKTKRFRAGLPYPTFMFYVCMHIV